MGRTIASVHYTGTLDDGSVFDSSEGREPLQFVEGAHQVVPGFENAVANLEVGQTVKVHIPAAEAYGDYDPNLIQSAPIEQIPNADTLPVGATIYFQSPEGYPIPAKVDRIEDGMAYFDFNHQLAGKDLNFEITLVSREDEGCGCDGGHENGECCGGANHGEDGSCGCH